MRRTRLSPVWQSRHRRAKPTRPRRLGETSYRPAEPLGRTRTPERRGSGYRNDSAQLGATDWKAVHCRAQPNSIGCDHNNIAWIIAGALGLRGMHWCSVADVTCPRAAGGLPTSPHRGLTKARRRYDGEYWAAYGRYRCKSLFGGADKNS